MKSAVTQESTRAKKRAWIAFLGRSAVSVLFFVAIVSVLLDVDTHLRRSWRWEAWQVSLFWISVLPVYFKLGDLLWVPAARWLGVFALKHWAVWIAMLIAGVAGSLTVARFGSLEDPVESLTTSHQVLVCLMASSAGVLMFQLIQLVRRRQWQVSLRTFVFAGSLIGAAASMFLVEHHAVSLESRLVQLEADKTIVRFKPVRWGRLIDSSFRVDGIRSVNLDLPNRLDGLANLPRQTLRTTDDIFLSGLVTEEMMDWVEQQDRPFSVWVDGTQFEDGQLNRAVRSPKLQYVHATPKQLFIELKVAELARAGGIWMLSVPTFDAEFDWSQLRLLESMKHLVIQGSPIDATQLDQIPSLPNLDLLVLQLKDPSATLGLDRFRERNPDCNVLLTGQSRIWEDPAVKKVEIARVQPDGSARRVDVIDEKKEIWKLNREFENAVDQINDRFAASAFQSAPVQPVKGIRLRFVADGWIQQQWVIDDEGVHRCFGKWFGRENWDSYLVGPSWIEKLGFGDKLKDWENGQSRSAR